MVTRTLLSQKPELPTYPLYNTQHPIARGLVFGVIPGGSHQLDIVSGNAPIGVGTGSLNSRKTIIGSTWESTSDTTGGMAWPITDQIKTIRGDFTILVWTEIDSAGAFASFFGIPYRVTGSWSAPFIALGVNRDSSHVSRAVLQKTVAGIRRFRILGTYNSSYVNAPLSMHTVTLTGGTDVVTHNNLVRGTELAMTGGDADFSEAKEVCINYRSTNPTGEGWTGATPVAFLWNRALSDREVAQLYFDPYIFIRPRLRVSLYAPVLVGATPKGPLGHPLAGAFGGPL